MFKIIKLLTAIGAVNWGSIGIFDFNFVTYLFNGLPQIEKMIYILVGMSGLAIILKLCIRDDNILK